MKWRSSEDLGSEVASLGAYQNQRTQCSHSSGPCLFARSRRSRSFLTVYSRTGCAPVLGLAPWGSVVAFGEDGDLTRATLDRRVCSLLLVLSRRGSLVRNGYYCVSGHPIRFVI